MLCRVNSRQKYDCIRLTHAEVVADQDKEDAR